MKNLKNMLFAAAIGAVLVPMVASAESCTIKDDKTVTVSADCELASNSNVKTITVNADRTLTITGNGTLNATFAGSGKIVADGATLKGTFDNKNISGKATIELDPSASFKIDKTLVGTDKITFAPNADNTRYAIYSDAYTNKSYVTYTCDKVINLTQTNNVYNDDAVKEATKTVYINSASGDYTFKLPAALGNYAYIDAVTAGTVSDDKKTVVIEKKSFEGNNVITVKTGNINDEEAEITLTFIKPAAAAIEENDAVVSAIVDDYVAAMNKDAVNPSFTTKVSTANKTVANIVGKSIVTAATNGAANNDIKAWAAANGYTVLQYFAGTAVAEGVDITVLPKAATVTGTANEDIVLPTAAEGKKVELVVLNLHGDTPEVVDNTVTLNANNKKKFTFETTKFSPMALAYHIVDATPAAETKTDSTETNTGDATKEANPKTSDNVMTSVVSLLVSAFGLTAAGLKLKNN